MGITVTANLTTISDCESVDWSGGVADTVSFIQGASCLAAQVKAVLSPVYTYTLGTPVDLSNGEHVYQWMTVGGSADVKANGGFRMYLEDSSGNSGTWFVGGGDTAKGWTCFVLDPLSVPDVASGTLDRSLISKVGVQFDMLTSVVGQSNNVFWDVVRYGTGLSATSLVGDNITMDDIFLVDDLVANKYGVLSKLNGVYFVSGKIQLGSTTGLNVDSLVENTLMVFTQDGVSSSFFDLSVLGSTGATSTFDLIGSVLKCSGQKATMNLTGTDSVTTFDGSTIVNASAVTFNQASTVQACVFDSCDAINPKQCSFSSTTIANTTETVTGALEVDDETSITNCSSISFTGLAGKTALYLPATVLGPITLDNFQSDGSGIDIYWAGTTGELVVNATNGTNFATSSTEGGTVTIQNSKSFSFNVEDEVGNALTGYEWRLYDFQGKSGEYGVELAGEEVATSDSQVYSFSYTSDNDVVLQVMLNGYVENISTGTLINADQSKKIVMKTETNS